MADESHRMLAQRVGAGLARGMFINGTLRSIIRHYVHPRVTGLENLSGQTPPLILAANHCSHMDTPLILSSLPKDLRHRTLVTAASDYFFANRLLGLFVSVAVGAVPLDRRAPNLHGLETMERLLEQKCASSCIQKAAARRTDGCGRAATTVTGVRSPGRRSGARSPRRRARTGRRARSSPRETTG